MTVIYDFILSSIRPFLIWWGKLHFPFSKKRITGEDYYNWRDSIEIGTVILTKTRGEFSNLINPTQIKHAGIYVGDINNNGKFYVAEATARGVILTDLVTFLTTKDLAVGCKPMFIRNRDQFEEEIKKSTLRFIGLPYDYLFKKGGTAFYCFELAAVCLKEVYPELQFQCREIIKGKKIYDENTFLDKGFFKIVFDSRKEQ